MDTIDQHELSARLRAHSWTYTRDPDDNQFSIPNLSLGKYGQVYVDAEEADLVFYDCEPDVADEKEMYPIFQVGHVDDYMDDGVLKTKLLYETADTAWDALSWAFRLFNGGERGAHVLFMDPNADRDHATMIVYYFE